MKKINMTRWFLLIVLISGCTEAANPQPQVEPSQSPAQPSETVAVSDLSMPTQTYTLVPTAAATESPWSAEPDPLQIEVMRQQSYPGSPIIFEQTLASGSNYSRYVVSYQSDGYKNYALMTIPTGEKPESGWPAIVFNHGYIDPAEYRTTERYVDYVDRIARSGYIVMKIDYRAHGSSEGDPAPGGGYGTPGYTVDALNALASLQAYEDADAERIGMWGHSMGGQVTLRAMVVSQDIKAGVIWGGVVAPYPDVIARWNFMGNRDRPGRQVIGEVLSHLNISQSAHYWGSSFSGWVEEFSTKYGTWDENPDYWATISPNTYLEDLSGPIQLDHSTTDEMVPLAWSEILAAQLQAAGEPYEFYTYPDDNHNISANFEVAMQRTVAFFDEHVKGQ